jgi:S1-C subfamily serine protease
VTVSGGQTAASVKAPLSVHAIYERSYRSVVKITVSLQSQAGGPFGGPPQTARAQGSGWIYDTSGDIVTNQHVVDGTTSIFVKFWNGADYKAHVVGTDPSTDLAVIRVNAPSSLLRPLRLDDSSAVSVGDGVVAIGSPFGLDETVTAGIVSALHRQISSPNDFTIDDSIQTDAAINHGNSGGPLLDAEGNVVGVNAQIQSSSGGNEGVGFAIPSNTVRSIVDQLLADGKAEHAFLGVSIQTIDSSVASRLHLPEGAEVTSVRANRPAAHAHLRAAYDTKSVDGQDYPVGGDVIVALGGKRITSGDELTSALGARKPGDRVELTYVRDGKKHTVQVTLANRPS